MKVDSLDDLDLPLLDESIAPLTLFAIRIACYRYDITKCVVENFPHCLSPPPREILSPILE